MIIGLGVDLVVIKRMEEAKQQKGFLEKYFSQKERQLFLKHRGTTKIASNFAVKEAVLKVLGVGLFTCPLKQIEVLRKESGKPYINLYGKARQIAEEKGINEWHVSLTNSEEQVIAMVIGEAVERRKENVCSQSTDDETD